MSYHYKKDGSLDMRYSSSQAAVASGYSGGGGSSYGSGYASYSSGGGYGYSNGQLGLGAGYSSPSSGSDLHYKKDGSLDMRYSSSKSAAAVLLSGSASGPPHAFTQSAYSTPNPQAGLNFKKDGTLDMRYASSKAVSSSIFEHLSSSNAGIHVKKDGSPDMRYSSSKRQASLLADNLGKLEVSVKTDRKIPQGIPLTKSGFPDMRTKAAKEWVGNQAKHFSSKVPDWIPKKKDGTPDTRKAIAVEFFGIRGNQFEVDHGVRERYYESKMNEKNSCFRQLVEISRAQRVEYPETALLPNTETLRRQIHSATISTGTGSIGAPNLSVSKLIPVADYNQLKSSFGDEETNTLGKGSFGVVLKGTWQGKTVAVKRLFLNQLNKRERVAFEKELHILAYLGNHPNLVTLYAYTLEPPCFIMEYVKLGNLSYILHYSTDVKVEAQLTCGKIKKRLLQGVISGMLQLHALAIVHGDLKPANVLVTEDYTAKITDFGLATLRGKTSSAIATSSDGENIIGGTGGYMAPELLDASSPPELTSDVYSFGVLLNEVVQEEEPYSEALNNFHGRGIFAAANYARLGHRPFIKKNTPVGLQMLILACWDQTPQTRPTFNQIQKKLLALEVPNSF